MSSFSSVFERFLPNAWMSERGVVLRDNLDAPYFEQPQMASRKVVVCVAAAALGLASVMSLPVSAANSATSEFRASKSVGAQSDVYDIPADYWPGALAVVRSLRPVVESDFADPEPAF